VRIGPILTPAPREARRRQPQEFVEEISGFSYVVSSYRRIVPADGRRAAGAVVTIAA
jgi:hypothetical protein